MIRLMIIITTAKTIIMMITITVITTIVPIIVKNVNN